MMKHYLFYDQNHDEKIFRYKVNYLWFFLAIIMFVMALVVIKTEISSSILFVLSGAIFCPGIPFILKYYMKTYYVQMTDTYVMCSGRINNLFGKRKIMYQDICYVEMGRNEPIIYPYGTTRKQMVETFGKYINVYDEDKTYLFSFRKSSLIIVKMLEKNPNIQFVECLQEYHV